MAAATALRAVALVSVLALATAALLPAASAIKEEPKQFKVGGPDGWCLPPPEVKEMYYVNWASGITFYVGDSLEFVFKNDSVVQVDKPGYYHCTQAPPPADAAPHDGKKTFRLDAPGYAYFASADVDRCKMGERLMINVLSADDHPAAAPATGPSSSAAGNCVIMPPSVHALALAALPVALAGGLL